MARKQRLLLESLPQMMLFKGNNQERIFLDQQDRRFFLSCLQQAALASQVNVHAFSLLPTQALLLLSFPDKQAATRLAQHLGRCYVAGFNQRHGRSGTLWQGRYQNAGIEPGSYFLLCQKYVETLRCEDGSPSPLNSVEASTGRATLAWLTPHAAFLALGASAHEAAQRYQQFLVEPMAAELLQKIEACLQQNRILGSVLFCQQLAQRLHRPVVPGKQGRPRKYVPQQLDLWRWLEEEARAVLQGYDYCQLQLPVLSAQSTPFPSGLRRDGTLGCLQAVAEGLVPGASRRLWYQGSMFRASDSGLPQEFNQIGAEAIGLSGPEIEFEQLLMQFEWLQRLQLSERLVLWINHLPGDDRGTVNALQQQFLRLLDLLGRAGVPFAVRPGLLPEPGFYQQLYYQWVQEEREGASVIAQGGRYDWVASQALAQPVAACGFAFRVEGLLALLAREAASGELEPRRCDVALVSGGGLDSAPALQLAARLRSAFPYLSIVNFFASASRQAPLAQSLRREARLTVIVESLDEVQLLSESDAAMKVHADQVLRCLRQYLY